MSLSRAETQHERLPGIMSMAKNNLILSGSVKNPVSMAAACVFVLTVSWQAGDVRLGCR